jgi:CRISPR-associated endoribonuclease Cas6
MSPCHYRSSSVEPHGLVLDIRAAYRGEVRMEFGIILIGRAVNFLPPLVFVVDEIGKQGIGHPAVPFRLLAVVDGSTGDGPVIFRAEEKALTGNFGALRLQDLSHADDTHVHRLSLEFLTPLRVKKFGDYQETGERMTFATLLDLLIRRLAVLAYIHCEHGWTPLDAWQEAASRLEVISNHMRLQRRERYSNRHQKELPLHGLVGTMGFGGELANFLPLLRMGEYTHIGAGTAFGLGQYRLHTEKKPVSSSSFFAGH